MAIRAHPLPYVGARPAFGLTVSLALHALLFAVAATHLSAGKPDRLAGEPTVIQLKLLPPAPESIRPELELEAPAPAPIEAALPAPPVTLPDDLLPAVPDSPSQPSSMAAPPAPTAEEWAFAGRYTLKNSKAYRYTWGQQVRSMMGTAVEGPDQGMVRLRVEIAPDGSLVRGNLGFGANRSGSVCG